MHILSTVFSILFVCVATTVMLCELCVFRQHVLYHGYRWLFASMAWGSEWDGLELCGVDCGDSNGEFGTGRC